MNDKLMFAVWVLGVVVSVAALIAAYNRVEQSPLSAFGPISNWFVPTAGFAVFPILGLICGVCLYAVVINEVNREIEREAVSREAALRYLDQLTGDIGQER
jgi:hypothetical protein